MSQVCETTIKSNNVGDRINEIYDKIQRLGSDSSIQNFEVDSNDNNLLWVGIENETFYKSLCKENTPELAIFLAWLGLSKEQVCFYFVQGENVIKSGSSTDHCARMVDSADLLRQLNGTKDWDLD